MNEIELYSKLYSDHVFVHPIKGRLHAYGSESKRDPHIIQAIERRIRPPSKIFDASCGRGHLMRQLIERRYEVEGSEIVDIPDLVDLRTHKLRYQELDELPESSFEAVISSDVLEHIEISDLEHCMSNLCRLSSEWMFLSVGLFSACNFPESAPWLGVDDLHRTLMPQRWWIKFIRRFIDVDDTFRSNRSFFIYGKKI